MLKTVHCFLGRRHHLTLDGNNLVLLPHGESRWVVFCNFTDVKKGQLKVKCLTVTCVVPVLLAALGAPPGGGGD